MRIGSVNWARQLAEKYIKENNLSFDGSIIDRKIVSILSNYERLFVGEEIVKKHPENLQFHIDEKGWQDTCRKVWQPVLLTPEMIHAGEAPPLPQCDADVPNHKLWKQYYQRLEGLYFSGWDEIDNNTYEHDSDLRVVFYENCIRISNPDGTKIQTPSDLIREMYRAGVEPILTESIINQLIK